MKTDFEKKSINTVLVFLYLGHFKWDTYHPCIAPEQSSREATPRMENTYSLQSLPAATPQPTITTSNSLPSTAFTTFYSLVISSFPQLQLQLQPCNYSLPSALVSSSHHGITPLQTTYQLKNPSAHSTPIAHFALLLTSCLTVMSYNHQQ